MDDDEIFTEWKRVNNVLKRRVAGAATKPKPSKRTKKTVKRGGISHEEVSSDDDDTLSEQGPDTKPPPGIFTEDEEIAVEQLIRGSIHPQLNDDNEATI